MSRTRRVVALAIALAFVAVSGLAACEPQEADGSVGAKRELAVSTAKQQLGKPYQYGAAGPGSYDCSGLTSYAWKAAGITLPRSSSAQYGGTTRITKAQLQPGDLIFYSASGSASSITHVAMFIGNGKLIQARKTGYPVEIQDVDWWSSNRVGYGRIKGV